MKMLRQSGHFYLWIWNGLSDFLVVHCLLLTFLRRDMLEVARRLATFFAFAQKVRKERRPHCRCPCGVSIEAKEKMGSERNAHYVLRQRSLLDPFFLSFFNGIVTAGNT
ncbi:hypothetical protein [uncultured Oxalicibacterium sp.]|uniref:hypothetical protein n=1 Tax=uncultured Oxalicibacterium sp. TaxID=1168540 RepID=UPI0025CD7CCA|nr:hypothetical protein [uncultured Oxalicibacterium sp.]